jgi:hypothetical protein
MTVYKFLGHAIRVMRTEPDIKKWGALIDALTPDQQAEVRPWLRVQAKIAMLRTGYRIHSDAHLAHSSPMTQRKR